MGNDVCSCCIEFGYEFGEVDIYDLRISVEVCHSGFGGADFSKLRWPFETCYHPKLIDHWFYWHR